MSFVDSNEVWGGKRSAGEFGLERLADASAGFVRNMDMLWQVGRTLYVRYLLKWPDLRRLRGPG